VALVTTAAVARNDDRPFDQDGEPRSVEAGWRVLR